MQTNGFKPSAFQEAIFSFVTDRNPAKRDGTVNAVAGSGKTTTLEHAARLLDNPGLFCAFNKHIAEALQQRLHGTTMVSSTIHALGMRTLGRSTSRRLNVQDNKYKVLVREYIKDFPGDFRDNPDAAKHLRDLCNFARLTLTDYSHVANLQAMAQRYNLEFEPRYGRMVESILNQGQRDAEKNGTIDFTDMVYLPNRLNLRPDPYPWVFVDEAQDLNVAQRELVMKCRAEGGRLLFVGDPRQAIMAFAGADSQSYYTIRERTDAHEMPLSICYRCPADIVTMAQEIVPQITARPDAPAGTIVEMDEDDITKYAQQGDLIMSRKNAPLLKHCLRLIRQGVHARVRGRDVGRELANLVREIGRRALSYERFVEEVEQYHHDQASILIAKDASDAMLEMLEDKCAAVSECYAGFSDCKSAEELAMKIEGIFSDSGTAVWFSSIHRAKGLEANRTWIIDYARLGEPFGKNSSPDQIEQEMNLKYVALTRSLDTMHLLRSPK